MAKISRKTIKRGFTLIEMSVVITIIIVFAAAIMPNLFNIQRSRETRQFFSKARDLLVDTRERAISDGVTRQVRYEDSSDRLVVERTNPDTGDVTEDRSLTLPDGVSATAFRIDKTDSNAGEWTLGFYADGRSESGDIEFTADGEIQTVEVSKTGFVKVMKGEMPDISQNEWDAGGYEQRAAGGGQ